MPRAPDPRRADIDALCADAGRLDGRWPADALKRWSDAQTPPVDTAPDDVTWSAEGRQERAWPEPIRRLALAVDTAAWLTCQRCLQPMRVPVAVRNSVRFVRGEAEADALDAEIDEDVLALVPALDLLELVEDELLLALPLVPRHEQCPDDLLGAARQDAQLVVAPDDADSPTPHPFAALAGLRRSGDRRDD